MARLLIGNFKGIKGEKGEKGDDGTIDSNSTIMFEDYTKNTPPTMQAALDNIKTGKSISSTLSNIKAIIMRMFALINNTINNNTKKIIDLKLSDVINQGEWGQATNSNYFEGTALVGGFLSEDGGYIQYNFTGEGITIYSFKNQDAGIMGIFIDDEHVADIDLYSQTELFKQSIFTIKNLEYKQHLIKFVKTGNKNTAAIRNWVNVDYLEIGIGEDLLTSRISKNFTTTDWSMLPAAPLVKELKENVTEIKDTLNTQLNYGYKIRRGIQIITFDSNGYANIAHNMAFTSTTSYTLVCNIDGLVVTNIENVSGNVTKISARNINSNGQLIIYTGNITAHWILVGK